MAGLFSAGVLLVHALAALPGWHWLALLSLPALLPWRGRAAWAVFALGALWCVWRAGDDLARRWPLQRHAEEVQLEGHVASLPEPGSQAGQRVWRFQFEPADAGFPRVRVAWYRADATLRAGDCWRLRLRMRSPHGSLNPGGFDYEAWLFRQGIGATATVRGAERCQGRSGPPWLRARQAVLDRYDAWLPGHPGLPLLAALTIGDDSALQSDDWDALRLTGTTHLIAISGFNVAIVAAVAFALARWAWTLWPPLCLRLPAQKAGMAGAALVGLAYALLAGWEPPVQRAALMLLALLAAAWFDRLRDADRVLAAVWLLVLLLDPVAVLSPGLWLSFGAVAAIFYVTQHRLAPAPAWREALRVQWLLSLALVPLSLYFFKGAAWLSPLVNLVAVPVVAVLTPLALLALLTSLAAPALGVPFLGLTASALERLQAGLQWLAAHADQGWIAAGPPPAALLLAVAGLLLVLSPRGLPLRLPGLLCLLPLLWPARTAPERGFELTALDVGQGLSIVVRTAAHTLVYDAGPAYEDGFDAGSAVVAPYLLRGGDRRIDALVISHPDQDHIGGAAALRRLLRIEREIGTEGGAPCRDGQGWEWDGVRFDFLHPDGASWSDNDGSCVLRIQADGQRALLTGDIGLDAERRLLAAHAPGLSAQLLVAPHHGGRDASGEAFVAAVQPQVVIYGAGWRHHFRHPRPEVVERYRAIGARQYVTGVSGALSLRLVEGHWQVDEYRPRAGRFWNAAAVP